MGHLPACLARTSAAAREARPPSSTKPPPRDSAWAKPWGDSDRYDFIVDVGGRLLKVQVKSAHRICATSAGGYHFRAQPNRRRLYRPVEIDLLVAYVVPEDVWYIFPPRAFKNMNAMRLFPSSDRRRSKFEKYREAWNQFFTKK
jgi:hypothetical protein